MHPSIAETYRAILARLTGVPGNPGASLQAAQAIRSLVEQVVLTPATKRGRLRTRIIFPYESPLMKVLTELAEFQDIVREDITGYTPPD